MKEQTTYLEVVTTTCGLSSTLSAKPKTHSVITSLSPMLWPSWFRYISFLSQTQNRLSYPVLQMTVSNASRRHGIFTFILHLRAIV
jgi:hypothetical protein